MYKNQYKSILINIYCFELVKQINFTKKTNFSIIVEYQKFSGFQIRNQIDSIKSSITIYKDYFRPKVNNLMYFKVSEFFRKRKYQKNLNFSVLNYLFYDVLFFYIYQIHCCQADYYQTFTLSFQMDQLSEAQIQNYTLINKIGQGSAAQVMLAKENSTKTLCVLKTIEKTGFLHDEEKLRLLQQKNAFIELTHPFLVQIHQSFQTRNHFIFALEYCAGGDLYTHLHMTDAFSEQKIAFYGAQLVLAIEYMHSKNVIHQDIKPENILIAKDGYLKLTDFGMSQSDILSDDFKIHSLCGTTQYIAPEMILEQGHGKAYDWWTLGCTLYEMLYKISPFYSDCREKMTDKILNSEPSFQKGVNSPLKEIIVGLLNKNPQQRLTFAKSLRKNAFFAKISFEKLLKKQYPTSNMMENSKGKKILKVDKAEVSRFTKFEKKYTSCCYLEHFDCFDVAQSKEETVSTISSIKKSRKMSTDASESDSQLSEKSNKIISSLKNCTVPIKLY